MIILDNKNTFRKKTLQEEIADKVNELSGITSMQKYIKEKENAKEAHLNLRDDVAYVSAELLKKYFLVGQYKYVDALYPALKERLGRPDLYDAKYKAALSFINQDKNIIAQQVLQEAKKDAEEMQKPEFAKKVEKKILENSIYIQNQANDINLTNEINKNLNLSKANNYKNSDFQAMSNDISTEYITKKMNNTIIPDSLAYQYALLLYNSEQYKESNLIVSEKLEELKQKNKVYSSDFANFLVLYGAIQQANPHKCNTENLKNVYDNAYFIANAANNDTAKRNALFGLIKLEYDNNFSYNTILSTNKFIEDFEDLEDEQKPYYFQAIHKMRGDFYKSENINDKAQNEYLLQNKYLQQVKLSSSIDKFNNLNNLIMTTNDENLQNIYNAKKIELQNYNELSYKHASELFSIQLSDSKYSELIVNADNLIQNEKSPSISKVIAGIYKNFALIYNKDTQYPFGQLRNSIEKQIQHLEDLSVPIKDKKEINPILFNIYKNFCTIFLDRNMTNSNDTEYAKKYFMKAENCMDKTPENIELTKKYGVLIAYKDKDYNLAEKYCEEYLGALTNTVFSINDIQNNEVLKSITGNYDNEKAKKISAAFEVLGLINLRRNYRPNLSIKQTFKDFLSTQKCTLNASYVDKADTYFNTAIKIRENMYDSSIELINDYTAISRILTIKGNNQKSRKYHDLALNALKSKYPKEIDLIKQEELFHDKYYKDMGVSFVQEAKSYFKRLTQDFVNPFIIYNQIFSKFALIDEDISL